MPKNKGKGGKNRKRGTNKNEPEKRELLVKEEGQEYAQVQKMMGNGRLEVYCFDGQKRLAIIRGKMRKKQWMRGGDIILVGIREYQDAKCDVIGKYNQEEARSLVKMGEIPDTCKLNQDGDEGEGGADDAGIVFEEGGSDDDSDEEEGVSAQPKRYLDIASDDEDEEEEEYEDEEPADPSSYVYKADDYKKEKVGGINIDDI